MYPFNSLDRGAAVHARPQLGGDAAAISRLVLDPEALRDGQLQAPLLSTAPRSRAILWRREERGGVACTLLTPRGRRARGDAAGRTRRAATS